MIYDQTISGSLIAGHTRKPSLPLFLGVCPAADSDSKRASARSAAPPGPARPLLAPGPWLGTESDAARAFTPLVDCSAKNTRKLVRCAVH